MVRVSGQLKCAEFVATMLLRLAAAASLLASHADALAFCPADHADAMCAQQPSSVPPHLSSSVPCRRSPLTGCTR